MNARKVWSYESEYSKCAFNKQGGVMRLMFTEFEDYISSFKNNSAIYGGAIHCTTCNMTLRHTTFEANLAD